MGSIEEIPDRSQSGFKAPGFLTWPAGAEGIPIPLLTSRQLSTEQPVLIYQVPGSYINHSTYKCPHN